MGLLTGDVQENPRAPVLVLTTEILHSMLLRGERLDEVGWLIFDEFHYLSDPERGRVWEQTMILCPRSVRVVCLSATVPNVDEVGGWMSERLGDVEVVVETERPVPLELHYFAAGGLHPLAPSLKRFDRSQAPSLMDVVEVLRQRDMTPALFFVFSRREAERQAGLLGGDAAFHHAGMSTDDKQRIEQRFGDGELPVLFATETFALGLNMPARTVVLPRLSKFDGRIHRDLTAREFQQMIGRAGRRGKDDRGHVVLVVDPYRPYARVSALVAAPLEPVRSAFGLDYSTYLNLALSYGDDAVEAVTANSFALYQLHSELAQARMAFESASARKAQDQARRRVAALEGAAQAGRHQRELAVLQTTLSALGYFDTNSAKATLLRGVSDANALPLAELLADPLLPILEASELAEVVSWFVGSSVRGGASGRLGPKLRQVRQLLEYVVARIQRTERGLGLLLTSPVAPAYLDLVRRIYAGEDVSEYRLSPGDLSAHLDRTGQLLRQFARASRDLPGLHDIAQTAASRIQADVD